MKKLLLTTLTAIALLTNLSAENKNRNAPAPPVVHPTIGAKSTSADGKITITLIAQKHNFGGGGKGAVRDEDIYSPKSVNITPDGKKYYINSLEGFKTVVYDMATHEKIKVINHVFDNSHASLWAPQSEFYKFTHYPKNNTFKGKPVESTFSHNGRYIWVPYYHRSYDVNSQDPSAVAVIDTKSDEIVRLFETGPLPKMIMTSHKGNQIAISHWGDNTIGLIDASSDDPQKWHHKNMFIVDHQLTLNYSTTVQTDRDSGSGNALRGTVFSPDDHYLLVSCMGGSGGIAVVDLQKQKYLGRISGMNSNVRHILIKDNLLYLSINIAGLVQRIPLDKFLSAIPELETAGKVKVEGWESCKVGAGARTIEISPSGHYVFAACNIVSKIAVVDTRSMQTVATIDCDSYPVGLGISRDGRYLISTSQGRTGHGGNAINIYEITYKESEEPYIQPLDTLSNDSTKTTAESGDSSSFSWTSVIAAAAGIIAIICAVIFFRRKK